jgi:hypothetical protein
MGIQQEVFHCLANSHRRNNFISSLHIDGTTASNQEVINVTIIQFYKNLFDETVHWRPKLDGLEFPLLDSAEADWLGRPYIYIYIYRQKYGF